MLHFWTPAFSSSRTILPLRGNSNPTTRFNRWRCCNLVLNDWPPSSPTLAPRCFALGFCFCTPFCGQLLHASARCASNSLHANVVQPLNCLISCDSIPGVIPASYDRLPFHPASHRAVVVRACSRTVFCAVFSIVLKSLDNDKSLQ